MRRRGRKTAPATVFFTSGVNDEGQKQLCVYVKCHFSDRVSGPIWGHAEQSVRRALATLTNECDCPAQFHKPREYEGKRINSAAQPRR